MISDAQLAANRANALLSTGPQSPAGKKASSLNALRSGFTSQVVVMPYEDMQSYLDFCRKYIHDLRPVTEPERQHAQDLANLQWRINRCHSIELGMYALAHHESSDSLRADYAEVHAAIVAAEAFTKSGASLETLSRHETRLRRHYKTTFADFNTMQDRRRAKQEADLPNAIRLYKFHKMQELAYDPAEDGFVLSVSLIERRIARAARLADAAAAENVGFKRDEYRKFKAA